MNAYPPDLNERPVRVDTLTRHFGARSVPTEDFGFPETLETLDAELAAYLAQEDVVLVAPLPFPCSE